MVKIYKLKHDKYHVLIRYLIFITTINYGIEILNAPIYKKFQPL